MFFDNLQKKTTHLMSNLLMECFYCRISRESRKNILRVKNWHWLRGFLLRIDMFGSGDWLLCPHWSYFNLTWVLVVPGGYQDWLQLMVTWYWGHRQPLASSSCPVQGNITMSDVTISKLYQLLTQTSHSQILQFIVFENEIVKTSLPPATIR